MATGQNRGLLRQLEGLFNVGTTGELTDGQLLERFATLDGIRAEQAFCTLVERHGPMVLRVCRGVLADAHETEDAFQATFLVLVKRARGLWVHDSLGPWLHQVALRTALCARSRAARRRKHERAAAEETRMSQTEPHDDLAPLLHDEINRLPDRFRLPLILCDLEGQTHEQAARQLGWPVGTVKSRLTRARDRLRSRLTRRGLAPTGATIAGGLQPARLSELLPEGLVSSTTGAAVKYASAQTILGGSAVLLAQGVLAAMSIPRWIKVASVLVVAGATVSGVGMLAGKGQTSIPVVEVNAGTFKVSATGRGVLEVQRSNEVINQVQSNVAIASILPDGTKVKQGELVAELDSTGLRQPLTNQQIHAKSAEAAYQNAKLTREAAEIAVQEYEAGIYASDRATIQGEINLAQSALDKAKARLNRTRDALEKLAQRLKARGEDTAEIVAELDLNDRLDSAQQAQQREKFAFEKAQSKLKVLEEYTKPKTLRELKAEVEQARSSELLKEQTWQSEKSSEASLISQIKSCKLYSPANGMIIWNVKQADEVLIPKQRIFWIFEPDSPMMVNVKVSESMVDRVAPGQKVRIDVDAFPGQVFEGTVAKVAGLPDSPRGPRGATTHKVYSTLVKVDRSFGNFRPGMTADAEILISKHDHVMIAPIKALLQYDGQVHVAVKKPDGGFDWRVVRLGETNGSLVEIKEGLQPGEKIAIEPISLMSPEEKHQKLGNSPRPTPPAAPKQ